MTIDPADAKDFDDALSMQKLENGNWEVGVHIADVTHYLIPGSVLDREAVQRATSVYLVDQDHPHAPRSAVERPVFAAPARRPIRVQCRCLR